MKRDPVTGSVALRTHFDESVPQLAGLAWQVATTDVGPRMASSAEVASWDDLHIPE